MTLSSAHLIKSDCEAIPLNENQLDLDLITHEDTH